ncbi:MAG: GNAT family N-acetyltransferase [Halobacteriales archaeon]
MPSVTHEDVTIRPATSAELLPVMRVLDGAMLAIEEATVRARIATDDVRVAVRRSSDRVLGAVVVDPTHDEGYWIDAIAVRSAYRGRGIGTALIDAIGDDTTVIVAGFDASARPFYRSLGFEIEAASEDDRFRGRYVPDPD